MNKLKVKENKGITLIALVVTIIVLLILATVSIAVLTGENGILNKTAKAKNETEKAQVNETLILNEYEKYLNNVLGGITQEEPELGGLDTVTGDEETPTKVQDSLKNVVVVPPGFVVQNPEDNVEDGIVIVDKNNEKTAGSEFVWIPVGKIHSTKGDKEIELKRYVFDRDGTINDELTKTEPEEQLKESKDITSHYYIEELKDSEIKNTQAKDIVDFRDKVTTTGGYYIGRYEARTATKRESEKDQLTQATTKPDEYVYNNVTQIQAAERSQNMYESKYFESDLVNSYAWDTAIVFLQEFDDRDSYSKYSVQTTTNYSLEEKGTNSKESGDVICNVYDMAGNCSEFSTETFNITANKQKGIVERGGYYFDNHYTTCYRNGSDIDMASPGTSFRPILYL